MLLVHHNPSILELCFTLVLCAGVIFAWVEKKKGFDRWYKELTQNRSFHMLGGHTLIWKLEYELVSVRREIPKLQNLKRLELCWKIIYLMIKHWLSEIRKNHFDVVYFLRYSLHTAAYLFLSLSPILNFMSLNGMSSFYFPQSEALMLILLIHAKKRKQWGASSGYLKSDQFFFFF